MAKQEDEIDDVATLEYWGDDVVATNNAAVGVDILAVATHNVVVVANKVTATEDNLGTVADNIAANDRMEDNLTKEND